MHPASTVIDCSEIDFLTRADDQNSFLSQQNTV